MSITSKQRTQKFVDLDLNFKPHPNTGDVSVKKDEDAVKQAIKTLVLTKLFERPFNPYKASRVSNLLFENFNPALEDTIEDNIRDLIDQYEPRAELLGVNVDFRTSDHSLILTIYFRVLSFDIDTSLDVILTN